LIPEKFEEAFPQYASDVASGVELWKDSEFDIRREARDEPGQSLLESMPDFIGG